MKSAITSVRAKLRLSKKEGCPGTLVYVVTHKRRVRQITTKYKLYPQEWDEKNEKVRLSDNIDRVDACYAVAHNIRRDLTFFEDIITHLDNEKREYESEDVVFEFQCQRQKRLFFFYMQNVIDHLEKINDGSTIRHYRTTLRSIKEFRQGEDLFLEEISSTLIEEYRAWLNRKNSKPNTIAFYMRILRATYKRAVEEKLVKDERPFSKSKTQSEKTLKRAISMKEIRRIKKLNLSSNPRLEFSRDMFLFLFYCRGMSLIDAAFLKITDIKGRHIFYRRHKINQELVIGINSHIRDVMERYHEDGSPYILPILHSDKGEDMRRQYEAALRRINNGLKKVGKLASISIPLTTYISRHSWATIAKEKGIPVAVISDALGHYSEKTTQIYLATISNDVLDKANEMILQSL